MLRILRCADAPGLRKLRITAVVILVVIVFTGDEDYDGYCYCYVEEWWQHSSGKSLDILQ